MPRDADANPFVRKASDVQPDCGATGAQHAPGSAGNTALLERQAKQSPAPVVDSCSARRTGKEQCFQPLIAGCNSGGQPLR